MPVPDSSMWHVNDVVNIGSVHHLRISAAHPEARFITYSLINDAGETFRYITGQAEPTQTGTQRRRIYRLIDMELPYFH